MAKKYYAVYYKDGHGKIFTRVKDFQREAAKATAQFYRGFQVKIEAEQWLKSPADFPNEKKFYAVKVGRKTGIYTDVKEYQAQLTGYPKNIGMSFYTAEGAQYWLSHGEATITTPSDSLIDKLTNYLGKLTSPLFRSIRKRWQLRTVLQHLSEQGNPWIFCQIITRHKLIIYTDASFRNGKAGYAAAIIDPVSGTKFYVGGSSDDITNSNRAELYAIISALRLIDAGCRASVEIHTDSSSLVKIAKPKYLQRLKKMGWQEPYCVNGDLWEEFYRFTTQRSIQVLWVKGHSDDRFNIRCDYIAKQCSL